MRGVQCCMVRYVEWCWRGVCIVYIVVVYAVFDVIWRGAVVEACCAVVVGCGVWCGVLRDMACCVVQSVWWNMWDGEEYE